MSDTRFTLIGVGLICAGFIVLGVFGVEFFNSTVESQEFDDCYEYFEDRPPVQISCEVALQDKVLFFALVIGLIAAGIISLIKGVRGDWDQKVRPEDMLGPGASPDDAQNTGDSKDNSDS